MAKPSIANWRGVISALGLAAAMTPVSARISCVTKAREARLALGLQVSVSSRTDRGLDRLPKLAKGALVGRMAGRSDLGSPGAVPLLARRDDGKPERPLHALGCSRSTSDPGTVGSACLEFHAGAFRLRWRQERGPHPRPDALAMSWTWLAHRKPSCRPNVASRPRQRRSRRGDGHKRVMPHSAPSADVRRP